MTISKPCRAVLETAQRHGLPYDGTGKIGYSYDTSGRRTGMTDSTGATTWAYRADGTTSSITTPEGAVSYTYDAAGRRTSMTQPQGTIHYTYDDAGRLATVADWNGATTNLTFNADGQLTKLTRPNQVTSRWSFDQAGRLVGVKHEKSSSVLASYAYSLDADGNRTSVATPDGTESYRYDQLGLSRRGAQRLLSQLRRRKRNELLRRACPGGRGSLVRILQKVAKDDDFRLMASSGRDCAAAWSSAR